MHATGQCKTTKDGNNVMVQVLLRQKYYAPQIRHDQGSNSLPPDHDSTFRTPALYRSSNS